MRISKRLPNGIKYLNTTNIPKRKSKFDRNPHLSRTWIDHPGKVALYGSIIILIGQLGATVFPIMLGPDLSDYNLLCDPIYHELGLPGKEGVIPLYCLDIFDNDSKALKEVIKSIRPFSSDLKKLIDSDESYRSYIENASGYKFNLSSLYYYPGLEFESKIYLENIHPLHLYRRQVFLTITCPLGFTAWLSNPMATSGQPTTLRVKANLTDLLKNDPDMWSRGGMIPITIQGIGADGKRRNCTIIIKIKKYDGLVIVEDKGVSTLG
jgi:hypothetical protein